MKTILLASILIFIGVLAFESCDKIEPPYRETTSGTTGTNDSTVVIDGDTIVFPHDTTPTIKKVLAEEYTGHFCGNCPYGGVYLNDTIKPTYGDTLVIISVHSGYFATTCPNGDACPGNQPSGSFTNDMRCPAGEAWNTFFHIDNSGYPTALIDRKDYPAHYIKGKASWNSEIQMETVHSPEFKMRIINKYDSATRKLKTAIQSKFLNSQNATFKLQVLITEDSIIDWQEWYLPNPVQWDPNYIHHHVVRNALNSTYGEEIAGGEIAAGKIDLHGYSFTLDPTWNASHCKVVAFVYDKSNYYIMQVEEVDVIQ